MSQNSLREPKAVLMIPPRYLNGTTSNSADKPMNDFPEYRRWGCALFTLKPFISSNCDKVLGV